MTGKIIKGIAGFYYVAAAESGIYACKAKGIFRKQKIKPLVGDDVEFEITHEEDMEGNITAILPRKNELIRPAAANVGQALILFAMHNPDPNLMLLDRFLISLEQKKIPCRIAFNKVDEVTEEECRKIQDIYEGCGCPVMFLSVKKGTGLSEVREYLSGQTTILAGPSGVGKSSLTNSMQDEVHMETGDISKKLARGKNTTRHAQLIRLGGDSYLFDTPGFSYFSAFSMPKEELRHYYHEFDPYEGQCYFQGCVHISEPDCAAKKALEEGKINQVRYDNYCAIYEELKEEEQRRWK